MVTIFLKDFKNIFLYLYTKKFELIILILYLIRILYVYTFDNNVQDTFFYKNIAQGILTGCGFGLKTEDGDCVAIVGHFFPFFHYLLSLFYLINLKTKSLMIFISTIQFCSNLNLYFTINNFLKNKNLSKSTLILLSLSPLTFGFSRVALIEPIIIIFSTTFLSLLITIYFDGFTKRNFSLLFLLQVIAIYFKPTSILFFIPFAIFTFYKSSFKLFLRRILIWFLVISLSIAPWGYRNILNGAEKPFTSVLNSTFFPENAYGYINWLSTWVVTEHEQAHNGFPIWLLQTGKPGFPKVKSPFKVIIQKGRFNPFIDNSEIIYAQKRIDKIKKFSKEDELFFNELAKTKRAQLGIFGSVSLYSAKMFSLLFNPFNSWGWPVEISNSFNDGKVLTPKDFIKNNNLNKKELIFKIIFKGFLFIYRIFIFLTFFKIAFKSLKKNNLFAFKRIELSDLIIISSLLFLFGTLYFVAILFPSLEHRFISVTIPWIEFSTLTLFFKK